MVFPLGFAECTLWLARHQAAHSVPNGTKRTSRPTFIRDVFDLANRIAWPEP